MLAILADDLTGALDSAAPFAARGFRADIALNLGTITDIVADAPDVISINLNTREISADDARVMTAAAIGFLPSGTRLFKKVDSRLKGNIAAELDATPYSRALAAPAIPAFDRIVEAGHVTGHGIDTPISISDRFGSHFARINAPDARTHVDLENALEAAERDGTDLLIGARGLAEALAGGMAGCTPSKVATIPAGRAIFIIGSRDPITLTQIDALRADIDLHYVAAPNGQPSGSLQVDAALTLIQATQGTQDLNPQAVAEALGEGLKESLSRNDHTLLLSGGATADAVMRSLGVSRLHLHGECLPGLGVASTHGRTIIAKSGGFGHPDTLKIIADMVLRKAC
ncbi:four-carbon acid sugar kinase family protein [Agrobacterium rubi]|uniref:four-carbon acid sugar kinase family protein n=1 Tax=Agrobacterium rubi TaxID=28099 RepID=UPI001571C32A|nr:four-carbon acid sugar kinase family protein [Agrobacterium rubi]NTF09175.1 four-carbon acid sugar kinase family protein [Agrobacterium rubi]NTF21445.1 four-carbon acid sugar kinase family protein [Agrobacterium rubi]NTF28302.1 four-carbon acid sugar kinase family protein [Agrobacterium rubi]